MNASEAQARRSNTTRLAVVLLVASICSFWALQQWRAAPAYFDDSFISFRYAYNLTHGHGLAFNPGERVEGYTNFLWVLLAAGALELGRDPLATTRAVGVGAYLVTVGIAVIVALRPRAPFALRQVTALAMVALLILPTGFASFAGACLETPVVALLVLGMGLVPHLTPAPDRIAMRIIAALLPLLAILTRLDCALAVVASAATMLWTRRRSEAHFSLLALDAVKAFGLAVLGTTVYVIWKLLYYGAVLPNTYYAKAADGFHFEEGTAYVLAFVQSVPAFIVLTMLLVFGLAISGRGPRAAFMMYVSIAMVLHVAYCIKVGGDFMEYRFMWEYWPLLVCGSIVAVQEISTQMLLPALAGAAMALGTIRAPPLLENKYGMQSIRQMNEYAALGQRVGRALERTLPQSTVVSTTLAGMSYFMPHITTIDQWGLNDKFVAHIPLVRFITDERKNGRGHIKYAPLDYLRTRHVNLYVEHPTICDCDHLCREGKSDVFVRLDSKNECVRTWYLTQTAELTQWFCLHPEMFVLDNVSCPAE